MTTHQPLPPPEPLAPVVIVTTETKPSYKTTELIAYVAAVAGVLIAAALVDDPGKGLVGFAAKQAWLYVTILTAAYLISRGLAKSGTPEPYRPKIDDDRRN
jgi:hypothetical protein